MLCVTISEDGNDTSHQLWNMRLAHISERDLCELIKQDLVGSLKIDKMKCCEQCILGKAKRVKFTRIDKNRRKKLVYVHSDL